MKWELKLCVYCLHEIYRPNSLRCSIAHQSVKKEALRVGRNVGKKLNTATRRHAPKYAGADVRSRNVEGAGAESRCSSSSTFRNNISVAISMVKITRKGRGILSLQMKAVDSPETSVTSYNVTPPSSHVLRRTELDHGES